MALVCQWLYLSTYINLYLSKNNRNNIGNKNKNRQTALTETTNWDFFAVINCSRKSNWPVLAKRKRKCRIKDWWFFCPCMEIDKAYAGELTVFHKFELQFFLYWKFELHWNKPIHGIESIDPHNLGPGFLQLKNSFRKVQSISNS